MSKKAVISGYIGFSNFGDDATLSVLTRHLKALKYEITALSASVEKTKKEYEINSIYYKNYFKIFKEILSANVLISGGGNLLQNETSTKSLFYYLFIIFLAKILGKKVIIFSQGIGPIKGFFANLITRVILKSTDNITVRDMESKKLLLKWGINTHYSYDAVWELDVPEYKPDKIIGVQVRNFESKQKDFYSNLAKYIDIFFSEYEIRIYSLQNSLDTKECYRFEKALKTRNRALNTKVVSYSSYKQLAEEFSHLKYLIAMRLHASILALKVGVKVLPVSYSIKVENFAKDFNLFFLNPLKSEPMHPIFTDFTMDDSVNKKALEAKNKGYDWSFTDKLL